MPPRGAAFPDPDQPRQRFEPGTRDELTGVKAAGAAQADRMRIRTGDLSCA
jgi:hypothetical protein